MPDDTIADPPQALLHAGPVAAVTAEPEADGDRHLDPGRTADVRHLCFEVQLHGTDEGHNLTRRITVHDAWGGFSPQGEFELGRMLRGWCHLHRTVRAFHTADIESVTDIVTGEVATGRGPVELLLSRLIADEINHGRGLCRCWEPANDR
ncbi:MAG TPA: hypothetical protein VGM87_18510 [Roseomonas sp.]|jgi:hypothetical protein